MVSARAKALVAAASLVLGAALPAVGSAATGDAKAAPTYAAKEEARKLATRGYQLYDAKRFDEAIEALAKADALYHAPTVVYALARAYLAAGKLVEAQKNLQRVVDEKLTPATPHVWRTTQQTARGDLEKLALRVPTVLVVVRGGATQPGLEIDGVAVPDWISDKPVPLNPGTRAIAITLPGGLRSTRSIVLREGSRDRIEVDLPTQPVAPVVTPTPPWLPAAIASFSVGAVGLAVGIGAGVSALKSDSSIKQDCGGTSCPPTESSKLASARTAANVSTVGFVVAGLGAAAGVTLLVLKPGGSTAGPVGLKVGPGSIAVAGSFR